MTVVSLVDVFDTEREVIIVADEEPPERTVSEVKLKLDDADFVLSSLLLLATESSDKEP